VRVLSENLPARGMGLSTSCAAGGYALLCGYARSDLEVETQDEDEVYEQFGRYFCKAKSGQVL